MSLAVVWVGWWCFGAGLVSALVDPEEIRQLARKFGVPGAVCLLMVLSFAAPVCLLAWVLVAYNDRLR